MTEKFASRRNLDFLLHEVFDVESLTRYPYYADHDREVFDLVLDTAFKMGRDILRPCLEEMDRNAPEFVGSTARVHPSVRTFMRESGEGGWIGAGAAYEYGGQQMPEMMVALTRFIFSAANYSLSVYPGLTTGVVNLIITFGTDEMKETYLPRLLSGEWQGTMALTEPQAGSSLADITTTAEPTDQGYYLLRGQKVFISAADHDGVDNVVNMMLAKIKGAPAGVKGISLFLVPKHRPGPEGGLAPNDINLAGIYHKMGYRGTPLTQLSIGENGDCRGFLVGRENQGLAHMFQMVNSSRIKVGMSAIATASAAYYAALDYARERPQGRRLSDKDPDLPQVPIIEHPDVRAMLLFQRAVVEGSLGLILQCARYADLAKVLEGEEAERYALLLDLLIPVVKAYSSEMGVLSVSRGLQCLGGYGYCDEFPLELYYRDVRIHPIHEGTTGIQGLDLLGRKVTMKGGRALDLYFEEVGRTAAGAAEIEALAPLAGELGRAADRVREVTASLTALKADRERFLADATGYLEFFSVVAVAWQWLNQARVAAEALAQGPTDQETRFYRGKIVACRYFFGYELPKIDGLARRLLSADALTVEMTPDDFED
ncbi:MAG: acyl-CoA dehydrogenase [Proteobacteria bacterium]|nr:acyl-CoA dehydrogenase [Pseudomonadota bacterium]